MGFSLSVHASGGIADTRGAAKGCGQIETICGLAAKRGLFALRR
jgi:hypothetical protein